MTEVASWPPAPVTQVFDELSDTRAPGSQRRPRLSCRPPVCTSQRARTKHAQRGGMCSSEARTSAICVPRLARASQDEGGLTRRGVLSAWLVRIGIAIYMYVSTTQDSAWQGLLQYNNCGPARTYTCTRVYYVFFTFSGRDGSAWAQKGRQIPGEGK